MVSIGRNDRCPCGSGLKFKKCCLNNGAKGLVEASVKQLKERVQSYSAELGEKNSIYFRDLKDIRKMSEIIIEFAQPILKNAYSFEDQRKMLTLAIVVWNICLTDEIDSQIEKICHEMTVKNIDLADDFELVMKSLVHRKFQFYSEIKRWVMDYDIIDTGNDSLHLNVISSPLDGDSQADMFEKEVDRLQKAKEVSNLT